RDSNSRPLAPHASALPGCATPRNLRYGGCPPHEERNYSKVKSSLSNGRARLHPEPPTAPSYSSSEPYPLDARLFTLESLKQRYGNHQIHFSGHCGTISLTPAHSAQKELAMTLDTQLVTQLQK